MKTPTLSDVARRAGVSYATADRVLNDRGGVAEKTVRKVRAAVEDLGYVRNVAAANLSMGRSYRFAFVIPSGPNAFFEHIRQILTGHASGPSHARRVIEIIDVPAFEPAALQAALRGLAGVGYDGITVVGIDAPEVVREMEALREGGAAVLTMVSDVAEDARAAYVGIDNVAAGRSAGRLMGLAHGRGPGRVQVIVGALTARDHRERLQGFREVLAEFPAIEVLPEIIGLDQSDIIEARLTEALAADPGITGVYNAGAGQSGIARLFARRTARPLCIVHELSQRTRAGMEQGLFDIVIDQRAEDEVAGCLTLMRALADRTTPDPMPPITPSIYVRDNLPPGSNRKDIP